MIRANLMIRAFLCLIIGFRIRARLHYLSSCRFFGLKTYRPAIMQGNVQRLIFSFLLVLAGLSTTAQKDTALAPAAIPEVSFYYGKVLNIHPFFPETKSASLVEMVWKHRNRGRRIWHQYHKYPDLGVSLSYVSLGNKEVP